MSKNSNHTLLTVKDLKVHFPIFKGAVLKKKIGYVKAVDGVNFHITRGETLGLVGESGCGKTTTGRAILQLDRPTAGKIYFDGNQISGLFTLCNFKYILYVYNKHK